MSRRSGGRPAVLVLVVVVLAAVVGYVVATDVLGGGSSSPQVSTRQAVRIPGWLTTRGTRIVTSSGRPVRLLGLDEPGLIAGSGNSQLTAPDGCGEGWKPVQASEFENFQRWGFNSVRLGLSWANLEPQPPSQSGGTVVHHWNQPYLAALDAAVKGFTSHGIAVILDMHSNNASPAFQSPKPNRCEGSGLPVWLFPDAASTTAGRAECDFLADQAEPGVPIDPDRGYADAWQFIASRYAGNHLVVAADIFNEPSAACGASTVGAFYQRIGPAIRAANPHLLLIYEDCPVRLGNFVVDQPLNLPNAVYSFHLYASTWPQAQQIMTAHLRHIASWRQPLWIGEFGVFRGKTNSTANVASFGSVLQPFVAFSRQHRIGWAFHQYSGGAAALVAPNGTPHTPWLDTLQAGF